MLTLIFGLKKFVPSDCCLDVFHIDYKQMYDLGKRVIFFDIDNTLIPYDEELPTPKLKELFAKIKKIGFQIIFMSNNHKNRVKKFADAAGERFVANSYKPLRCGYRKAKKMAGCPDVEILTVGDQILTDVLGSRWSGLDIILVRALKKKNEKWFTKINRRTESRIIEEMKDKYPDTYGKIKEITE